MDPFTAIGLVGNIITFLDFGYKLVSATKDIHASAFGSSAYNENLSHSTQQLQQLVANLKVAKPPGSVSDQELSLLRVAYDCEVVSARSLAGCSTKLAQDEKFELEQKLDRCKQQLNLELVNISRSESSERLNKLLAHGQASGYELQSLIQNVEYLRSGINVSCLGSEALGQIKSLLQLSDDAILNVRRARILDALRFEHLNERFEDIEEAHRRTFSWIFASEGNTASTSDNSLHNIDGGDEKQIAGGGNEASSVVPSSVPGLVHTSSSPITDDIIRDGNSTENDSGDNSSFEWILDDLSSIESDDHVSDSDEDHGSDSESSCSEVSPQSETPLATREYLSQARDSFISWLRQDSGIFYISGKPGSGKSTLMKYISQHHETKSYLRAWAGEKKFVFGTFFFWKPGSVLQKSIKGLIRGLLYRLLSECHDLIPFAFPVQWESSANRESVHIEHHECREAFERLISASKSHGECKIALFVDGLDEFEGNHAALIRQLLAWCNGNPNVKICVSSREWAIFKDAFGSFPKFRLHDLTSSDIRLFVRDRFREMHFGNLVNSKNWVAPGISNISDLEEVIVNESEGVFLWVSIVLRHVEDGLANGDRLRDLVRLVRSLPNDLEPLFQQLLELIPRHNRRLAYSMLSLTRYYEGLRKKFSNPSLLQFSFLEEYTEDKNFALKSEVNLLTTKEKNGRLETTKKRIYGLCKSLLEVRPRDILVDFREILGGGVHLIHRSISEFLGSKYFIQKLDQELPGFDPCDAYSQTYLGLLQRVHLPTSYYASRARSKRYVLTDTAVESTCPIRVVFDRTFYLPLRYGIESMIERHINAGQQASPRFHELLNATYKTLLNIKVDLKRHECTLVVHGSDVAVCCDPKDLMMIICGRASLHEYLCSNQNLSPELMSCCFSAALLGIRWIDHQWPILWRSTLKSVQAFFNHGFSPDSSIIPSRESTFHVILQDWCCRNIARLEVVALMLYYGVNPRFSLAISKTKYTFLRAVESIIFRLYFASEYFTSDPDQGMQTKRILRRSGKRYTIEASATVLETIEKHGHIIDLRTLVSIWFPDQSTILQEVIDWITALGCPVEAHHRAKLQERFGSALRPFFDPDHPNFVDITTHQPGWQLSFPGYSEKNTFSSLYNERAIFLISKNEFSKIRRYVEEEEAPGDESGTSLTAL
ncbi:hypothetical protein F4806DRAFT_504389 [Annulohypoxylon nitens]|nr:hypothetical protein F4806DRAFT_504389 [Annulohypoxylon nitens]